MSESQKKVVSSLEILEELEGIKVLILGISMTVWVRLDSDLDLNKDNSKLKSNGISSIVLISLDGKDIDLDRKLVFFSSWTFWVFNNFFGLSTIVGGFGSGLALV